MPLPFLITFSKSGTPHSHLTKRRSNLDRRHAPRTDLDPHQLSRKTRTMSYKSPRYVFHFLFLRPLLIPFSTPIQPQSNMPGPSRTKSKQAPKTKKTAPPVQAPKAKKAAPPVQASHVRKAAPPAQASQVRKTAPSKQVPQVKKTATSKQVPQAKKTTTSAQAPQVKKTSKQIPQTKTAKRSTAAQSSKLKGKRLAQREAEVSYIFFHLTRYEY